MKNKFFETSPLGKKERFAHVSGTAVLSIFLIAAGICIFAANGYVFGSLFSLSSATIIGVCIWFINPKMCHDFLIKIRRHWIQEIPPDSEPNRLVDD